MSASTKRSAAGLLFLFILFFLGFCLLDGKRVSSDPGDRYRFYLLTGDEPHYLLMAHSVALDLDVDLYNNIADKHYLAFYNRPVSGYIKHKGFWMKFVKGWLREAPDEYWAKRALSVNPIGMPILIAPAYRLGFAFDLRVRYFVVLFFHLLAATTAVLMIQLVWRQTGKLSIALLVPSALAFSAPFLFYTVPIFPEVPAALLIALCLMMLDRAGGLSKKWMICALLVAGCCIGYLPFLHSRFGLDAVWLGIGAVWVIHRHPSSRAIAYVALAAPCLLLLSLLAGYFYELYGVPLPLSSHPPFSLEAGAASGWLGLWLDRDNGLLAYTPLALLVFPGCIALWRGPWLLGRLCVLMLLTHWIFVGAYSDWRGGLCPPMRYWVSAVPLIAISIGAGVAQLRMTWMKWLCILLGATGIAIAVFAMDHPGRLYRYMHPVFAYWPPLHYRTWAPEMFPESTGLTLAVAVLLTALIGVGTWWLCRRPSEKEAHENGQGPRAA